MYSIDLFISFVNFVNRDAQQGSIGVPTNKSCECLDNLRYHCSQGRSYRNVIGEGGGGGGGGCQPIFGPLKRVITFEKVSRQNSMQHPWTHCILNEETRYTKQLKICIA